MFVEALRDRPIDGIESQREIRREHERGVLLRSIVGIGNGARTGAVLGPPLMSAGRTLREFPVILKEVVEEGVAPLGWSGGPGAFQSAGDRIRTGACAEFVLPAEALLLDIGAFGFSANILRRNRCAMGFAEAMSARD